MSSLASAGCGRLLVSQGEGRLTAAMLTQASAPSSRGKHSGRMTTSVTMVMTRRRSAMMLSAPARCATEGCQGDDQAPVCAYAVRSWKL